MGPGAPWDAARSAWGEASPSLASFAVGRRGVDLVARLRQQLGGDAFVPRRWLAAAGPHATPFDEGRFSATLEMAFRRYRGLVLVLPIGVAARLLAPHLRSKRVDPAVVVVDEAGRHAVALLSGHAGGANTLAKAVAAALGARPIVTTSAEALGCLALDLLGQRWGWTVEDARGLTRASAALINGEPVGCFQDAGEETWWSDAPRNLVRYSSYEALMEAPVAARIVVSDRLWDADDGSAAPRIRGAAPGQPPPVVFRPKTLVVGVGCVRGIAAEELEALLEATLRRHGLAVASVRELATIDAKRDEAGIAELARRRGWPVRYLSAEELAAVEPPSGRSETTLRAVGAGAVCEPAALRAARAETLVVPKVKTARATVAVARAASAPSRGRLSIVGLGPGGPEHLTARARAALEAAEVVVGYHGYLDQVRPWLGAKRYHGSPLGEEIERCRLAIALARAGHRVALVSSGDAGIYGMAGPVFELLGASDAVEEADAVEVVPGVSAAQAAAALLGAPLMCDYATISLSDLLVPWSSVERRIEAVAAADLVVALYNPASQRRRQHLARAREILLRYRSPETPVGVVRNAGRPGQTVTLTNLAHLLDQPIDMLTVVIVGNSATVRVGSRMVTRRGYGG